jgi:hypothetical protein
MGINTRVMKTFVTNKLGANTGTSVATITSGDILLLDRGLAPLSSDTIGGDALNDLIYVAMGIGATGEAKFESIPTKGISKVTSSLFSPAVQHKIEINGSAAVPATSAAGTNFNLKFLFHDTHRVMDDKEGRQFFVYTTKVANETAETIFTALAAKINTVKFNKQLSASVSGTGASAKLVVVGLAVADNAFGLPQFRYFHVALRSGFLGDASGATTVVAGNPGKGTGMQVRQLELDHTRFMNRTSWPMDVDNRVATTSGAYNFVTIEYVNSFSGHMNTTSTAPKTLVLAFAAAESGTPTVAYTSIPAASTMQTNFITQLTSLVESPGVTFVSE